MSKEPYATLNWLNNAVRKGYTEKDHGLFENKFLKIFFEIDFQARLLGLDEKEEAEFRQTRGEEYESETFLVESSHAYEYSWAVFEIQKAFSSLLTEKNKREFYETLGRAMNREDVEANWAVYYVVCAANEFVYKLKFGRQPIGGDSH